MKISNHFLLTILLLFSFSIVKAQPCLPFGITFTTQTDIDSFTVDHPGCTEIQGVLVIASSANDPITNLQGLSVITKVMGGVYIQQNTQLSNLNGLSSLHTIQGGLHIIENTGLLNLTGLESLEVLNGSLEVKENKGLLSLNGLQGLHLINGSVILDRNHQMMSLHGLDSVGNILGDLDIHYNLGLLNVDHLSKLSSIGGDFKFHFNNSAVSVNGISSLAFIGGSFDMRGNLLLENLAGMENLGEIGGDFYFNGTSIKQINALNSLQTIGGSLTFWVNSKLETLEGLINLSSINGELFIRSNNQLKNLYGLDNIDPESITDLTIRSCFRLNTCEVASICSYLNMGGNADIGSNEQGCLSVEQVNLACEAVEDETLCLLQGITISRQGQLDSFAINYPGCVHILGDVTIQSGTQDPINNVGGLNHIEAIEGDLRIRQNSQITQLNGFDSLHWVGGDLEIEKTGSTYSVSGFNKLKEVIGILSIRLANVNAQISGFSSLEYVGKSLRVQGDLPVENCGEFEALKSIGVGLTLIGCNATSLDDFITLEYIGSTLRLHYLNLLQRIDALESIESVRILSLEMNEHLTDLYGLHNISTDTITKIEIQNNPNLSTCHYPNICAYLDSGKPATINNNAPGCNSIEEILAQCVTSSGEVYNSDDQLPQVLIFPNPASAYLNIYAPADIRFKARLYNIIGQELRSFEFTETKEISLHDVPSGLYMMIFEYEGGLISRKIVIE